MFTCKQCQYFVMRPKHIAQKTKVFGHCTMPRIKIRDPDAPACLRFQEKNTKKAIKKQLKMSGLSVSKKFN